MLIKSFFVSKAAQFYAKAIEEPSAKRQKVIENDGEQNWAGLFGFKRNISVVLISHDFTINSKISDNKSTIKISCCFFFSLKKITTVHSNQNSKFDDYADSTVFTTEMMGIFYIRREICH